MKLSNLIVKAFAYLFLPVYLDTREIFLFGSRKSAKTKHVALRLIMRCMWDREYNAVAMRKIASELKHSVKEELDWAIRTLRVERLWEYKISERVFIYKPGGNRILLKGIDINPTSGKPSLSGLNLSTGRIKDVWMEEAWEFTKDDYSMIRQTIRGGLYTILIVGNPYFSSIWCVRRAIELKTPTLEELKTKGEIWSLIPKSQGQMKSIVHWNNFLINTKLSEEDLEERWEEEKSNPKDFITTGYGYPGSPSGTILGDLYDKIERVSIDYFNTNVIEYGGGLDVGLERDATACVIGGITPNEELVVAGEYYHSNGMKEANRFSNDGVWTYKEPHMIARDCIDFYMTYEMIWSKRGELVVAVDNADSAFLAILRRECELRGIKNLNFVATKGEKMSKGKIEKRVIFERQMLSRGLMKVVEIDGIVEPQQLMYEIANLPWKQNKSTGINVLERDDSKVPDHITNAWEYMFRRWVLRIIQNHRLGG